MLLVFAGPDDRHALTEVDNVLTGRLTTAALTEENSGAVIFNSVSRLFSRILIRCVFQQLGQPCISDRENAALKTAERCCPVQAAGIKYLESFCGQVDLDLGSSAARRVAALLCTIAQQTGSLS